MTTSPTGADAGPGGGAMADPSPSTGRRRWWALGMLTGANLLVFASVTIMNVALPYARADLGLSPSATQAVVTLYSLTFGTLILLGGRVADTLGLRRCLVAGLIGFAASALLGGLATGAAILLVARAAQGIAGALVAATAVPLMSVTFPSGRERRIAFATLGVVMGLGTAGSFLLGGATVALLSWRWALIVNVPLALLVAAGVYGTAPRGPRGPRTGFALRSAALICSSLGVLTLGLDRATTWGWLHPGTLALVVAGALGIGFFASSLRHTTVPLIPVHLLRDPVRNAGYLAAFWVGVAMFAGMFVLTSFMQEVWNLPPLRIGLAFLPFVLGAVLTTWLLPKVRARIPPGRVLAGGLVISAVALATFIPLGPTSGYAAGVLPAMIMLGSGGTVVMITAGDIATAGAGQDSGVAGSLVNAAQQVGAALGTALLVSVMTGPTRAELAGGADRVAATVAGYSQAGSVGAILVMVSAITVLTVRRRPDRPPPHGKTGTGSARPPGLPGSPQNPPRG